MVCRGDPRRPAGVPRVPHGAAGPGTCRSDGRGRPPRRVLRGLEARRRAAARGAAGTEGAPAGDRGRPERDGRHAGRAGVRAGRRRSGHREPSGERGVPAAPDAAAHARGHRRAQRPDPRPAEGRAGTPPPRARRVAEFRSGAAAAGRRGVPGRAGRADLPEPPVREVVSVTGQEAKVAARSLTGAGFRVEYTQGQAGGRAIGSIIRQDPAGGTTLPRGRLVILTVNNPPAIEVPALEEMNVGQARDALKDRAMLVGKVIKIDGTLSNTPEGRVIAQLPEAGSSAQRGQSVQLLISTGISAKETWLPNLTGLTFDQARAHARAAGLVVTSVERQPSDQPENTVLEQTPAPYVRVDVGSPVKLTVASARYSAPSRPAGNLPLPPAYVPPTPVQPEAPQGTEPTTEPVTPDAVPATPDTGSTGTGTTTPPAPETAQPTTPATPEIAPTEPQSRSVNFEYVFPGDLPAGNYTVVVRDDDGERQIMPPTAAANLANRRANSSEAAVVRGNAVFVIRRDGVDYATVTP
ncbi:PASTA domain-containing protein [Deinococcus aquaticus]|uniref:PASTA domain-containing protein n=1 Tax=Deinococcus aquaticus TaxID=328692 RepID=UPI0036111482